MDDDDARPGQAKPGQARLSSSTAAAAQYDGLATPKIMIVMALLIFFD